MFSPHSPESEATEIDIYKTKIIVCTKKQNTFFMMLISPYPIFLHLILNSFSIEEYHDNKRWSIASAQALNKSRGTNPLPLI